MKNARQMLNVLPPEEVGKAVLNELGAPFQGNFAALQHAQQNQKLRFHAGYIGGAWPQIKRAK